MKILNVSEGLLRALILLFTKPRHFWNLMRWQPKILRWMITGEVNVHLHDEKKQ
jgi:hypothetical protein